MKQSWRIILRTAKFQSAIGLLGGVVALGFKKPEVATAFLLGGAIVAVATLVAAVVGLRRANSPADSLAKVLGASFSKWLLIVTMIYLALTRWQIAGLPLMLGLITAQLSAVAAGLGLKKF